MLLSLQDLGGAIARAHKWTSTYIDCLAISGLTLTPMISQTEAPVKLEAWRLSLGPVAMKRCPRFMDL